MMKLAASSVKVRTKMPVVARQAPRRASFEGSCLGGGAGTTERHIAPSLVRIAGAFGAFNNPKDAWRLDHREGLLAAQATANAASSSSARRIATSFGASMPSRT